MSRRLHRTALFAMVLLTATLGACSKDPDVAKEEFLRSGDQYFKDKKYPEAILQYRNAIQLDPAFGEARVKLAEAYTLNADPVAAYREYMRAADLLQDDMALQVKTAEVLLAAGSFVDAEARASRVIARDPKNVTAHIIRANAMAGLNRVEDAVREIEQVIEDAPGQPAAFGTLGSLQLARGNVEQARAAFEKAVEVDPNSVEARVALGGFYWRAARRPEEAVKHFDAAVKLDPKNVLANRTLATFYLSSGRGRDAEPHFQAVAEVEPTRGGLALGDYYAATNRLADARQAYQRLSQVQEWYAIATLRLAVLELSTGDAAGAARRVEEVLTKTPGHVEALVMKAQLLSNQARFEEALSAVSAAALAEPQLVKAQFTLGKIQLARHQDEEALAAFRRVIAINPRHANALTEIARIRLEAGDHEEAQQAIESAARIAPADPAVALLTAQVTLARGNATAAERSLRDLAVRFPQDAAVQAELGMLELVRGNGQAAQNAFQQALSRDPRSLRALSGLAQVHMQSQRTADALRVVDAAVAASPNDAALGLLASRVYAAAQDTRKAEAMLRKVIQLDPSNPAAYAALGGLYTSLNRLPDALTEYTALAERQPRNVAAQTAVGVILTLMKRPDEAMAAYERALAVDSRAPVAANNLAWLYLEKGQNLDIALQLAQTAKAQQPNSPGINDTLGVAYLKRGLASQAIPPLQIAVQREPRTPVFHAHLGMAYAATGEKARARESLNRAFTISGNFEGADEARKVLASVN